MDDDQLVYLQNLILTSNEALTDAFAVYEEDQDPVRLAESLKQVSLVWRAVCAVSCVLCTLSWGIVYAGAVVWCVGGSRCLP